jgi:hypothetical protein
MVFRRAILSGHEHGSARTSIAYLEPENIPIEVYGSLDVLDVKTHVT